MLMNNFIIKDYNNITIKKYKKTSGDLSFVLAHSLTPRSIGIQRPMMFDRSIILTFNMLCFM